MTRLRQTDHNHIWPKIRNGTWPSVSKCKRECVENLHQKNKNSSTRPTSQYPVICLAVDAEFSYSHFICRKTVCCYSFRYLVSSVIVAYGSSTVTYRYLMRQLRTDSNVYNLIWVNLNVILARENARSGLLIQRTVSRGVAIAKKS